MNDSIDSQIGSGSPLTVKGSYFPSNGRGVYVIDMNNALISNQKLAFSWNICSTYEGNRFVHLLKRFFTTWRIREYHK